MSRLMHLAVFAQGVGVGQSVWRSPRTAPDRMHTFGHWAHLARTAERGCFDAFFIADALNLSTAIETHATDRPDPLPILSALSVVTDRIGLIGTSSTTYNDPFTVARQFATLDHLSDGRAGWNVATTAIPAAAENYGAAGLPEHTDRYVRGEEFVDIVRALWDGWDRMPSSPIGRPGSGSTGRSCTASTITDSTSMLRDRSRSHVPRKAGSRSRRRAPHRPG